MNTISVLLLFLAVVFTVVSGSTTPKGFTFGGLQKKIDEDIEHVGDLLTATEIEEEEEKKDRFRRATCDLLSVSTPWGSLNHSACAAHCLAKRKGYRGGRCKQGVCHCRR